MKFFFFSNSLYDMILYTFFLGKITNYSWVKVIRDDDEFCSKLQLWLSLFVILFGMQQGDCHELSPEFSGSSGYFPLIGRDGYDLLMVAVALSDGKKGFISKHV